MLVWCSGVSQPFCRGSDGGDNVEFLFVFIKEEKAIGHLTKRALGGARDPVVQEMVPEPLLQLHCAVPLGDAPQRLSRGIWQSLGLFLILQRAVFCSKVTKWALIPKLLSTWRLFPW